jgi:chorismate mutase
MPDRPRHSGDPSDSSPDVSADDMAPLRDRIDELDRQILNLLNERAVCANEIGHIKKQLGLPVYMPSREDEVLANVCDANAGPLPDEAVRRLFERVIDETRSLERKTFQLR